jgi:hypothetical protein
MSGRLGADLDRIRGSSFLSAEVVHRIETDGVKRN